ncbi:MAG: hypothetical protein GX427_08205 [Actinomycetales bacterium]|nr:hypothetical protein [Actinomycetales bacterium]
MSEVAPGWAPVVVWAVVNGVNLLQGIGFLSRIRTRGTAVNHALGFGILALGVPALVALVALVLEGAPALHWIGAVVFLPFLLMGLPMYTLDRGLWLVTVATTVFHLGAMGAAMRSGVG